MSAKGPASLYDVLGVSPAASAQDVRQAWRRLARQHHPDRSDATDSEAMALINQAYEVLSDAERRARYDLGRSRSAEPRRPGRVRLPADRRRMRLGWGAALALVAAWAVWAVIGQPDEPSAPPPGPTRPGSQRAAAAPSHSPPVRDATQVDEDPLRLIPARRIEARPDAAAASTSIADRRAPPGPRTR